jgi:hypothetical protein
MAKVDTTPAKVASSGILIKGGFRRRKKLKGANITQRKLHRSRCAISLLVGLRLGERTGEYQEVMRGGSGFMMCLQPEVGSYVDFEGRAKTRARTMGSWLGFSRYTESENKRLILWKINLY